MTSMSLQLRWIVLEHTTTEPPRLQWREVWSTPGSAMPARGVVATEWQTVPVVAVPAVLWEKS